MVSVATRLRPLFFCTLFAPFVAAAGLTACGDDDDDGVAGRSGSGGSGTGGSGTGGTGTGGSGTGGTGTGGSGTGGTGTGGTGTGGSGTGGSAGGAMGAGGAGGGAGGAAGASGAGGAGGAVVPPTELDDAGVVSVISKANEGEIAQGQIASSKAERAEVKAFGQHMVVEHTNAQTKLMSVAKAEGITAEENALSRMLESQSDLIVNQLLGLSGPTFDEVYLDSQIVQHEGVLSLIDLTLLPSTDSGPLQGYLLEVRVRVAQHLQEARGLRDGP
ncbi:MAG TPA: DUF4142 domain-containing protein [Polyangiaceae bacterium]|nr:DUF4142 domain-containing protein [Polyangiaceae bacterium]